MLVPGEYAAPEGSERALFAVLEGRVASYRLQAEARSIARMPQSAAWATECCRWRRHRPEPPLGAPPRLKPEQRAVQVVRYAPMRTKNLHPVLPDQASTW